LFAGAIGVYEVSEATGTWVHVGDVQSPIQDFSNYGLSIKISGKYVLVGANGYRKF
jgi:hypothetical protein